MPRSTAYQVVPAKIVALDPGGTTGVAIYKTPNMEARWPTDANYQGLFSVNQLGPDLHHEALWALLTKTNPPLVICERFQSRPNIGGNGTINLDAPEYVGVARLYCQLTKKQLVLQQASAAKGLWTDAKLKRLGLWQPNSKHAMDALRHLLYYLTVTVGDSTAVRLLR